MNTIYGTIDGNLAGIRTRHLLNTSLTSYDHTSLYSYRVTGTYNGSNSRLD